MHTNTKYNKKYKYKIRKHKHMVQNTCTILNVCYKGCSMQHMFSRILKMQQCNKNNDKLYF